MNPKSQIRSTIISYSGQIHDFVAWMQCSANKCLSDCCLSCIYLAGCRVMCSWESCSAVSQALCSSLLPCEAIRVPIRTGNSKTGIFLSTSVQVESQASGNAFHGRLTHPNTRLPLDLLVCQLRFSVILPLIYLAFSPSPSSFPPSHLKPPSPQVATVLPTRHL